jgi:hypothetical protein
MAKIIWRDAVVDRYFNQPSGKVGRFLHKKGKIVLAASKAQAGSSSGMLRSSIHMRHNRDPRGQYIIIGSRLSYAKDHPEGTKPRIITPEKRRTLRFFSKGVMFHSKLVKHPGTKPNKYLTDNLRLVK